MALDPAALAQWKINAEIDYCEYFRKAYEPFNAWFKDSYGKKDSTAISKVKVDVNVVRTEILLLLKDNTLDSLRFRQSIGLLHERLERQTGFPVATRGSITLRECWITDNPTLDASTLHNRVQYRVKRLLHNKNNILCEVKTARGIIFSLPLRCFDEPAFLDHPQHSNLTLHQTQHLQGLYRSINPRLMKNLLDSKKRGPHIQAGTIRLCDDAEDVFAGLVEIIYCLRCVLVHGDIKPTTTHHEVYEPAYFILRRFLKCIV